MAKGYWIARIDVNNAEEYGKYAVANQVAFKKYGAKYIVRGGSFDNPEGQARARNVVIEFPSLQAAKDCWESPEYKAATQLRIGHGTADIIIIEGYVGAQP
jgi:uncharacterized protein (DUF1330 family)